MMILAWYYIKKLFNAGELENSPSSPFGYVLFLCTMLIICLKRLNLEVYSI